MNIIWTRVAAVCLLAASTNWATASDQYVNQTLGLSVTKPAAWVFLSAADVAGNLERTKLDDKEFEAKLQKYASAPLVAIAKHPEPFDDLNPSFRLQVKPYGALQGKTAEELLQLVLPQLTRAFKDAAITQAPTQVTVAGISSAYGQIEYTLEAQDGRMFPTTSEIWIVPRESYFMLIGAGTRQDEKTGTRQEIRDILNTLTIED